jgi:hypothetical protein
MIAALAVLAIALILYVVTSQARFLAGVGHILTWLRDSVPIVVTWPVVVVTLVIYLGTSRVAAARIASMFGRFRSVKLLGAEIAFSEEGARRLATDAEQTFDEFRRQADLEFQRQASRHDLRRKLELIFQAPSSDISNDDVLRAWRGEEKFRCTIHVPDILFH